MEGPELKIIRGDGDFKSWSMVHKTLLIDSAYGAISETIGNRSRNFLFLVAEPDPREKERFRFPIISVAKHILTVEEAVKEHPGILEAIFEKQLIEEELENNSSVARIYGNQSFFVIVIHDSKHAHDKQDYGPQGKDSKTEERDFSCIEFLVYDQDYRRAATKTFWKWRMNLKSETRNGHPLEVIGDDPDDDEFHSEDVF